MEKSDNSILSWKIQTGTVKHPRKDAFGAAKVYPHLENYLYQSLGTAVIKTSPKSCVIVIFWAYECFWSPNSRCATTASLTTSRGTSNLLSITWAKPNMRNFSRPDRDGVQHVSDKPSSWPPSASLLTVNSTIFFSVVGSVHSNSDLWLSRSHTCIRSSETVATWLVSSPSAACSSLTSCSINESEVPLTSWVCFQQLMITLSSSSSYACWIQRNL